MFELPGATCLVSDMAKKLAYLGIALDSIRSLIKLDDTGTVATAGLSEVHT